MRSICLVITVIICFAPTIFAAPYLVIDEPQLRGAVLSPLDFGEDGDMQWLFGKEDAIWLGDEDGQRLLVDNFTGPVAALAYGDLTGEGREGLVAANDRGAVYTYLCQDFSCQVQGEPYYLWDTAQFIAVYDLNGDGKGDLIALSSQGEARAFLAWEGRLYPFWLSSPQEVITHLEVVDINNDGLLDIVYTYQSGYIGILTWRGQQFETLWENFPWGLVESLTIVPDGDYPELLIVTSQKMVYGWQWHQGQMRLKRHFHAPTLGEHVFYLPGRGLLSLCRKQGVSLFQLESAAIKEEWNLPGLYGVEAVAWGDGYLIRDENKGYVRLLPGSPEWKVFVDGQEVAVETFREGSLLYFNLQDLGPLLGFSLVSTGQGYVLQKGHDLQFTIGAGAIEVADLKIPLANPILEVNGQPYATCQLFSPLGWLAETDKVRHRVEFRRNWGWWL